MLLNNISSGKNCVDKKNNNIYNLIETKDGRKKYVFER